MFSCFGRERQGLGIAGVSVILLGLLSVMPLVGQDQPPTIAGPVSGSAQSGAETSKAPLVLTLQDAMARAKSNDPQFRAALTELGLAYQDVVQSRAGLLPNVSLTSESATSRKPF